MLRYSRLNWVIEVAPLLGYIKAKWLSSRLVINKSLQYCEKELSYWNLRMKNLENE